MLFKSSTELKANQLDQDSTKSRGRFQKIMVLIILGTIEFDAEKFETRTMPTPDMKGKEMIYWIKLKTADKRLAIELERYLKGSSHAVDLRVPGAFVVAKTELENYTTRITSSQERDKGPSLIATSEDKRSSNDTSASESQPSSEPVEDSYFFEILLRRKLPETKNEQTQAPYG
jgi:hypothetical protein